MSAPVPDDGFDRFRTHSNGAMQGGAGQPAKLAPWPKLPPSGHTCDASTTSPHPLRGYPVGYVCVLRAHHNGPVHRGFSWDGSQMEWHDQTWWQRLRRWLGLKP